MYVSDFLNHSLENNHSQRGMRNNTGIFKVATLFNSTDNISVIGSWSTLGLQQYVTTQNWSGGEEHSYHGRSDVTVLAITVLFSVIAIMTASSNLLIIVAFCRTKKLRKATNYFYISLAVSDCLIGVSALPLAIYDWYQDTYWQLGKTVCIIWLVLDYFLFTSSVYNVAAICLDRYLGLFHGLWYRRIRTNRFVIKLTVVAWILGLVFEVPAITVWEYIIGNSTIDYNEYCSVEYEDHAFYTTLNLFLSPIGPWVFIIIVYVRIYAIIRRSQTDRKPLYGSEGNRPGVAVTGTNPTATSAGGADSSEVENFNASAGLGCPSSAGKYLQPREERGTDFAESFPLPSDNKQGVYVHESSDRKTFKVGFKFRGMLGKGGGMDMEQSATDLRQGIANNVFELEDIGPRETCRCTRVANIQDGRSTTATTSQSTVGSSQAGFSPEGKPHVHNLNKKGRSLSGDKAARLVSILVASFLVCFTPWVVISVVEASCSDECLPFSVYNVALWLQYANSLVNPFLYVHQDLNFRLAVINIFFRTST
ncbi:histamine H3 receptor-like [Ptychodera flava]|uniref:histamine H3 receptor-like n=1 Tax=Ptychodera flava TaxID=63121 RepID=UPI003969DDF2